MGIQHAAVAARFVRGLAAMTLLAFTASLSISASALEKYPLHSGWKIQSSCVVKAPAEQISTTGFSADDWLPASVPTTVLGAQVDAGKFENPFFGMNLRKIPGTEYPVGKIYAHLPMLESSPYRCSWWYRTEFNLSSDQGLKTWLHLNGINYRANIWLNGTKIADQSEVAGAFRTYQFDVTTFLARGANTLAIETFAQTENDLGISLIDWSHAPADKSLGLWRDAYLTQSGPVTVRNSAVNTHFVDDQLSAADLTILTDVQNATAQAVSTTIVARIGKIQVSQVVQLQPNETRAIKFSAEQFPPLRVRNPDVWWPFQYGVPHLETLRVTASTNGAESDVQQIRFGIREVQGGLNEKGYLQFRINRRNILIRGGGWSPDMFYREPADRLRQELEYVREMNLNTIRLEGKLGSDVMFDLADEMGILIMAGWACCDHWEHWDKWTDKDHAIANASLYSQISRLRSHPSVFVWLNGSDGPPPANVETDYMAVLKERGWANPFISSATGRDTTVTGPSGVKMSGPYDYVPPEYWSMDHGKYGGAYGFNTETGPGPAIPSAEVVRRTLPQSSWWPQDDQWNFHAALGKFAQYNIFNRAMATTYGEAKDLNEYTRKAQLMTYDGERAMFEAYSANKYISTGVIQWMLNNAWPSFHWHLYDYYLVPSGGYFGTKKANEPLHVQYRYDDHSVLVVNSTLAVHSGLHVQARVVDLQGKPLYSHQATVAVPGDGVVTAFVLPEQNQVTLLELALVDASSKRQSKNVYWLPAKLANLDWAAGNYFHTPGNPYADMRALAQMQPGTVTASAWLDKSTGKVHVTLANRASQAAFFIHARGVKPGTDEEISPVFWDDNFISLLPGESQTLSLSFLERPMRSVKIKIEGWNVAEQVLELK